MPRATALLALSLLTGQSFGGDVERWMSYEIPLQGPSSGNPFVDVQLRAIFTLANASAAFTPDPPLDTTATAASAAAAAVPAPLVSLDFSAGTATSVPNSGTSAASAPSAQILRATRSGDAPAGSGGQSLDLGGDVTTRHVVELPGDKRPFTAGLAGLRAFTIAGWIKVRSAAMGAGGDRVLNFCGGDGGIDLVWDTAGGGRLKLAVNEWPDGDHPASAPGSMPADPTAWPQWRFFAVTYNTDVVAGADNVQWYFGNSLDAAALDDGATGGVYNRGAVEDPKLPLAFGNFGSGFHANDRLLRGLLFAPQVWDSALTAAQVVAVQNRAGCKPACGAADTCGSDGCGGSCGACSGARTCGSVGGGPRTCQMPTTITVNGFYDGGSNYKVRFAPPFAGSWSYTTTSNGGAGLDGQTGTFVADEPSASNHGPVIANRFALQHDDGTPHFSVGSTSYQWTSKGFDMQAQTLQTLLRGPDGAGPVFNKLRSKCSGAVRFSFSSMLTRVPPPLFPSIFAEQ